MIKIRLLTALVLMFALVATNAQYKDVEKRFKNDVKSLARLKEYKSGGIEKSLNIKKVSKDLLIKTAKSYMGIPHCMGGTSQRCLDCSGLLFATFKQHGIKVPHGSEEMSRYGKIIASPGQLRKGDLVFFINSYKTSKFITHSGIYLGNGNFIHVSSKNGVEITTLQQGYWKDKFVFGTRVF